MESDKKKTPTVCPDCKGELKEIRMIDDARFGHQRMRFTLMGEKRSMMNAEYSKTGYVDSFTCIECGRIFLYRSSR